MERFIQLLGKFTIEDENGPSALLKHTKGCALLAYLVVNRQPQPREQIADLLWESSSTEQSLRNLRVLLTRIRPWLPELLITRTTLTFRPGATTTVDLPPLLDTFYRNDVEKYDVKRVEHVLPLYRGEFLADFYVPNAPNFTQWLLSTREWLHRQTLDAYAHLCGHYARQKQWELGIDAARRWLVVEPIDERAYRCLMRHLAAAGQLTEAIQQYKTCREQLLHELDTEPEPATVELAEALFQQQARAGNLSPPAIQLPPHRQRSEPGPLPPTSFIPFHRNDKFIGREGTLLHLAELLLPRPEHRVAECKRAVLITGMGGLGKTQLAVEFAYRYGRYFPGGVYWLSFAKAEYVAEEVARIGGERSMGLYSETEHLSLADQVGRVQKAWQAPVPRLLIFDNCEDEMLLSDWLPVTGGSRVLVTSRRGEWSHPRGIVTAPLTVLSVAESVTLLRHHEPKVNAEEGAEIAAELGYLPLALHLAGGFLRRYAGIRPDQYLSQLRTTGLLQHPSLQGRGAGTSPTGHELNVARTFALSLEQLDPRDDVDVMAKQALACAACFAPGEPIPQGLLRLAASHIHAADQGANPAWDLLASLLPDDGLARLVTLGILEAKGSETVVLHRLLAAFTSEVLMSALQMRAAQQAVENTIAQKLATHFDSYGPMSILPFSAAHLRRITDTALEQQMPIAAELAILLGRHLMSIANSVESERYLKRAFSAAQTAGVLADQVKALHALSSTQENLGHYEDALHSAQQAIDRLETAGIDDAEALSEAFFHTGKAHFRLVNAEAALDAATQGYQLAKSAGLSNKIARNLSLMGVINYYLLERYKVAAGQLEESLIHYRAVGDLAAQAAMLNNMGDSARLQGDYAQAIQWYEEALDISSTIQDHNGQRVVLNNLCGAQVSLGKFATTTAVLEDLIAQTHADWYGLSEAFRFLSEAYLGLGEIDRALSRAQQALKHVQDGNMLERGRSWRVLGRIAAQTGQPVQAYAGQDDRYDAPACFERGMEQFDMLNLARDRAVTLWYWAQYEQTWGDPALGDTMQQKAREIFKQKDLALLAAHMERERL